MPPREPFDLAGAWTLAFLKFIMCPVAGTCALACEFVFCIILFVAFAVRIFLTKSFFVGAIINKYDVHVS